MCFHFFSQKNKCWSYTDDYVTRGVTLGGNSSAIATALLLLSDPRAAALSSLSMSLFGIITLALTSVPPIARAIASLVDKWINFSQSSSYFHYGRWSRNNLVEAACRTFRYWFNRPEIKFIILKSWPEHGGNLSRVVAVIWLKASIFIFL